jgi:ABC-2 type transport system permease protein
VSVAAEQGRAGVPEAVRSEWIKLRSVRSTAWAVLALVGISVLFSAFAAWESETLGGSPGRPGDNDMVLDSLAGVWFGQMALAVLGVLAITSEFSTRSIRTTFAANPRRRTVLASKTAVVATVALAAGLATSVACFVVGREILQSNGFTYEHGYPTPSLADGATFRAVAGTAVCLALLGVFALGVGAVLRHTAGAITVVLASVLAPVIAIGFLPEDVAYHVERVSLMGAGLAVQQTVDRPDNIPLTPAAGLGVVAAYAAVALLAALLTITRRDA